MRSAYPPASFLRAQTLKTGVTLTNLRQECQRDRSGTNTTAAAAPAPAQSDLSAGSNTGTSKAPTPDMRNRLQIHGVAEGGRSPPHRQKPAEACQPQESALALALTLTGSRVANSSSLFAISSSSWRPYSLATPRTVSVGAGVPTRSRSAIA
jgi:hypothetical protein